MCYFTDILGPQRMTLFYIVSFSAFSFTFNSLDLVFLPKLNLHKNTQSQNCN